MQQRGTDVVFGMLAQPLPWQEQHKQANLYNSQSGAPFPSLADTMSFLQRVIVPKSSRWAYLVVGKTGTSLVLSTLYELEFGVPLSTGVTDDLNSHSVAHTLHIHGIFRAAAQVAGGPESLQNTLRIASVRHPALRAVSSFRYFCKSDDCRANTFLADRLMITALLGFDWSADKYTRRGFELFLRYVELGRNPESGIRPNSHWAPQTDLMMPKIFQPRLVGRLEAIEPFFEALAAALGTPVPCTGREKLNRQPKFDPEDFIAGDIPAIIEGVFADDFETLGYDPDWRAPVPADYLTPALTRITT